MNTNPTPHRCETCDSCKLPRTVDDNGGAAKCKLMKYKTIDGYVAGGYTPDWCPLNAVVKQATNKYDEIKNLAELDACFKCERHLFLHRKIMVSISGGSDSDIILDFVLRVLAARRHGG